MTHYSPMHHMHIHIAAEMDCKKNLKYIITGSLNYRLCAEAKFPHYDVGGPMPMHSLGPVWRRRSTWRGMRCHTRPRDSRSAPTVKPRLVGNLPFRLRSLQSPARASNDAVRVDTVKYDGHRVLTKAHSACRTCTLVRAVLVWEANKARTEAATEASRGWSALFDPGADAFTGFACFTTFTVPAVFGFEPEWHWPHQSQGHSRGCWSELSGEQA